MVVDEERVRDTHPGTPAAASAAAAPGGDVNAGSLLGPVVGLSFSRDGAFLFSCVGSSISTYSVNTGDLLSIVRVFAPGIAVSGLDVGQEGSFGAVYGDAYVNIVAGVPGGERVALLRRSCPNHTGAAPFLDVELPPQTTTAAREAECRTNAAVSSGTEREVSERTFSGAAPGSRAHRNEGVAQTGPPPAWFQKVVSLPRLSDRVWDARLIDAGVAADHTNSAGPSGEHMPRTHQHESNCANDEQRGRRTKTKRVALALAHNSVEVWEWDAAAGPARLFSAHGSDRCLLYHAKIFGRTMTDLRIAAGTVFNQVLVWQPDFGEVIHRGQAGEVAGNEGRDALRLEGHEGVIFRVTWSDDGKRLASVSDDRTVRVWNVDGQCLCRTPAGPDASQEARRSVCGGPIAGDGYCCCGRRRLALGWGHTSRVWDVAFTSIGVVTSGEDGTCILWRESRDRSEEAFGDRISPGGAGSSGVGDAWREGEGSLVPAAILRGHSGSHVWRLAVHDRVSRGGAIAREDVTTGVSPEGNQVSKSAQAEREEVVLLATGGNDGACKLWDLSFEAARERHEHGVSRSDGGREIDSRAIKGGGDGVNPCRKKRAAVRNKGWMLADKRQRDGLWGETVSTLAASACEEPRADDTSARLHEATNKAPALSTPATQTKSQHRRPEASRGREQQQQQQQQQQDPGGRLCCRRRRQKGGRGKPVVVREIRLHRRGTGAALLLGDGSVWWVPHLGGLGRAWELVVAPASGQRGCGDAAGQGAGCRPEDTAAYGSTAATETASDETTVKGAVCEVTDAARIFSSSGGGASAIAIVDQSRGEIGAELGESHGIGEPSSDTAAEGKDNDKHRRTAEGVAIVVGRDDGFLVLLSSGQGCPAPSGGSAGERHGSGGVESAPPTGAWRVAVAWRGHRSRVTSLWGLSGYRCGCAGPGRLVAALDTSRLGTKKAGVYDDVLVSAAADGTLAWWEWVKGVGDDAAMLSSFKGVHPPRVRMMCSAGLEGTVSSVAIDDQNSLGTFKEHEASESNGAGSRLTAKSASPAPTLVYCGNTKGSIICFVEERRGLTEMPEGDGVAEGGEDSSLGVQSSNRGHAHRGAAVEASAVLKRQHGKDQISQIALLGDCLLSAGHDGQVNHYVVHLEPKTQPALAPDSQDTTPAEGTPPDGARCPERQQRGLHVRLVLVTCYATSPITSASGLWIGVFDDESGDARTSLIQHRRQETLEGSPRFRLVVAGRSGASNVAAWDLTEGRQLLELECGDRHLAQDMVLAWPRATLNEASASPQRRPPTSPGSCRVPWPNVSGDASPASRTRLRLPLHTFAVAGPASSTLLPPFSGSHANDASSRSGFPTVGTIGPFESDRPSGCARHSGTACSGRGKDKRRSRRAEAYAGVALRFHSTLVGPRRAADDATEALCRRRREQQRQQQRPAGAEIHPVLYSPAGEVCAEATLSQSDCAQRFSMAGIDPAVTEQEARDAQEDRRTVEPPENYPPVMGDSGSASVCPATASTPSSGFAYSLGAPFHGQRVVSARFLPRARSRRQDGQPGVMRLLTCGEDGIVKLLEVSPHHQRGCCCHGRCCSCGVCEKRTRDARLAGGRGIEHGEMPAASSLAHGPGADASAARTKPAPACCLRARIVQTLPRHESSIGAIAVAPDATQEIASGSCARANTALVASGGGKMELRIWRYGLAREDQRLPIGVPLVSWLLTSTPAPRSSLLGHRIMSLCFLPAPPVASHGPLAYARLVSGDSGGGVAVFGFHDPAAATGAAAAADGTSAADGKERARLVPIGRRMSPGERPVLTLAHARVHIRELPQRREDQRARALERGNDAAKAAEVTWGGSGGDGRADVEAASAAEVPTRGDMAAPDREDTERGCRPRLDEEQREAERRHRSRARGGEHSRPDQRGVVDLVVSGDTAGFVTVWAFLDREMSAADPLRKTPWHEEDGGPGGFVRRGPAGRRQGSVYERGEGDRDGQRPALTLRPVLTYRAHQMGVLSMTIHVPPGDGRFVVVTGGDDQALCIAAVEVFEGHVGRSHADEPDEGGENEQSMDIRSVSAPSGEITARLQGGVPEHIPEAAGSAIKGLCLVPHCVPTEEGDRARGAADSVAPPVEALLEPAKTASVFAVARDQRLSRWELSEERPSPTCAAAALQRRDIESQRAVGGGGSASVGRCDADAGGRARKGEASPTERGVAGWRLRWCAGCVTDVCDVSGIAATALSPVHYRSDEEGAISPRGLTGGREHWQGTGDELRDEIAPAVLVAVSGQGLQLVHFGPSGVQ